MDAGRNNTGATAPYRELTITRIFDAPRELVFKMWTEPKHLMQWWGPKIFTTPVCDIDLRVGGAFRIVTAFPDWGNAPMKGVFSRDQAARNDWSLPTSRWTKTTTLRFLRVLPR